MTAVSTELTTYQMFINGEWIDAASGQSFESLNPYTGQV
jgi:acyl-CoA reductase-like NAD-dependent aldehyde dehydrogenase